MSKTRAVTSSDPDIVALIAREREPANRIRVPGQLRDPHPLIQRIREALDQASPDYRGLLWSNPQGSGDPADIAVSRSSLLRGLRLMDTLYRALEARRHRVVVAEQPSRQADRSTRIRCVVLGATFQLQLREKARQVKAEGRSGHASEASYGGHRFEPTGILELSIPNSHCLHLAVWKDTDSSKLEDGLNQVIIAMLEAVEPRRQREEEAERSRAAQLHSEEQQKERDMLRKLELTRAAGLEGLAERWEKAQRFRAFVAAVREEAVLRHGSLDAAPDVARWLEWAEAYVRSIDPLGADLKLPTMDSPGDPPIRQEEHRRTVDRCPRCRETSGWTGLVCSRCTYGLSRR